MAEDDLLLLLLLADKVGEERGEGVRDFPNAGAAPTVAGEAAAKTAFTLSTCSRRKLTEWWRADFTEEVRRYLARARKEPRKFADDLRIAIDSESSVMRWKESAHRQQNARLHITPPENEQNRLTCKRSSTKSSTYCDFKRHA